MTVTEKVVLSYEDARKVLEEAQVIGERIVDCAAGTVSVTSAKL
jgi:hypothetical protein